MRKLAVLMLSVALVAGQGCFGGKVPGVVDPEAELDPNATYTVVFWDVEVPPLLGPAELYKEKTLELIEQFNGIYPNIKVEVEWLPWHHASSRLDKALRDGNPPDVYISWQGLARYDHVLQVPADLYLEGELHAAAERAATVGSRLWAWPRWLWPRGLVMLREDLALEDYQLEQLLDQGWDLAGFELWLKEQSLEVAVNDYGGGFTGQLLLAATGANFERGWGGQELGQLLAALEAWRDAGLIYPGEYQDITQGNLIIGGGVPALVNWLADKQEGEVVLLPLPGFYREVAYRPVDSTTVMLFRQVKYKGDQHTRAAAAFAQWLAQHQAGALAGSFGAIPAWPDVAWDSSGLTPWYYSYLADCVGTGVPLFCNHRRGREAEDSFRQQLNAQLNQFWAGNIDANQLAAWMMGQR